MENEIRDRLLKEANRIYDQNRVERNNLLFHQPSLGTYECMYGWDAGWAVIAASAFNPEVGIRELETLYSFQREDGSITHQKRFEGLGGTESLERKLYRWSVKSQYDSENRTMMIDPPAFLLAAEIIYNKTKDKRILDLLPKMQSSLDYLLRERTLSNNGLIAIIHPLECGCDNAPYFDRVAGVKPSFGWKIKYEYTYYSLLFKLKKLNWNPSIVKKKNNFFFEDLGINGLAAVGAKSLGNLWSEAGNKEKAELCFEHARKLTNAIEENLWDEKRGFFYPKWYPQGNKEKPVMIYRSCLNGVAPLLSSLVDKEKAIRVFNDFLMSDNHFKTPHGISFNSLGEEDYDDFEKQELWRGPCQWMNMNWMAAYAASTYGFNDLAKEITRKTATLIDNNGFREYYNPHNGQGGGATDFTWAALIIDMIDRHGM